MHLAGGEYWDLTPPERVALLKALATLALAAEHVRDVMQARAESQQLLYQTWNFSSCLSCIRPVTSTVSSCFSVNQRLLWSQQSGTWG